MKWPGLLKQGQATPKIQIPFYQDNDGSPNGNNTNCPICNGSCAPIKHGSYTRNAVDGLGIKTRVRVQRYLCKRKKRTYSLLPEHLIPYRAPSLGFLAVLWRMLLFIDRSQKQILSAIVDGFPESSAALNMDYSHLNDVKGILQVAMNRVTALTGTGFPSIQGFFEFCSAYVFNGRTGWLAVTQWFYEQQHRFLFGTASQHR